MYKKEIEVEGEIKKALKFEEKVQCPVCNKKEMIHSIIELELPYFGSCINTNFNCSCGYRKNDVFVVNSGKPVMYELNFYSPDHLSIRVARSDSGTLSIPELGLSVEPSNNSVAYVTNIEGIFERFIYAVNVSMNGASEANFKRGQELLDKINEVKEGKLEVTIILKDPLGNSIIDSPEAIKKPLSEKEVQELSTGRIVYDNDNDNDNLQG